MGSCGLNDPIIIALELSYQRLQQEVCWSLLRKPTICEISALKSHSEEEKLNTNFKLQTIFDFALRITQQLIFTFICLYLKNNNMIWETFFSFTPVFLCDGLTGSLDTIWLHLCTLLEAQARRQHLAWF